MSKKIKVNPHICYACCYHMGFGSQPGKDQIDAGHCANVACNYLGITGKSRIFEDGKMAYKPEYCDKFVPGEADPNGWSTDSMTEWIVRDEKQRLWKELENANGSKY